MAVVNPMVNLVNVKDSRWLTLEVCREFQRNKCTRTETECKFAHPPPHVEVQNGRVTCCFDSIKGKCQRKDPPCKYLHPPQHLKEQLLQNGRNNLILKNLQMQALASGAIMPPLPQVMPMALEATSGGVAPTKLPAVMPSMLQNQFPFVQPQKIAMFMTSFCGLQPGQYPLPGIPNNPAFSPYIVSPTTVLPGSLGGMQPVDTAPSVSGAATVNHGVAGPMAAAAAANSQKLSRPDRLESTSSSNGSDQSWTYADSLAHSSQYSNLYLQPTPVVEVSMGAAKKRHRDPAEDLILQGMTAVPGMVPYVKRPAVADTKSGVPMYQPGTGTTAYHQALAAMQMQQQSFVPAVTMPDPSTKVSPVVTMAAPSNQVVTLTTPPPGNQKMTNGHLHTPARIESLLPANAASVKYYDDKNQLLDRIPVCRDFKAGGCIRPKCKYIHLVQDYVEVSDGKVTVCRDAAKGSCVRQLCKYYHIPVIPKSIV